MTAPVRTQELLDTGYDWMGRWQGHGWRSVSCWGEDGWDLGDWPYLIYMWRHVPEGVQVAEYCEGDIDTFTFENLAQAIAHLDSAARWFWTMHTDKLGDDAEQFAAHTAPERFRGPYVGQRKDI